jgi:salicylate hydroxylase
MRVVVAGGGIGGLALAQGLKRAGIEVVVHERDARPEYTGGYRLHLDDTACSALGRLLPPPVLQAVLASAAGGAMFRRFTFCDHRLRELSAEPMAAGERLMIGRVPLRTLLAHDLDVRWGSVHHGHTSTPDGRVRVDCSGGSTTADVLVGADGTGSAIARALAGRPTAAPTGVDGIAGKVPLDDDAALADGPALAFGPGGLGVFLSVHEPGTGPVSAAACTSPSAIAEPASLVLGPLLPADRWPRDPGGLDGPGLVGLLGELLLDWHPRLRELGSRVDPGTVAHFRFLAADPDADPAPWPTGNVTAIGDAVHAMPPTGGRGAATAVRDADVLTGHLVRARDGGTTVPLALLAYEREMAGYGPAAVRESLQPLALQRRIAGPIGATALRAAGTVAAASSWLRLRTGPSRTGRPG